jgi:hypothetical protein
MRVGFEIGSPSRARPQATESLLDDWLAEVGDLRGDCLLGLI